MTRTKTNQDSRKSPAAHDVAAPNADATSSRVPSGPPVLRAKLHPPDLPADFVPRHRLLDLISQNRTSRLTLVSAAAGYGKSSLVRHSLNVSNCESAWISLDEEDNDCRTFLAYTVAALQNLFPNSMKSTAPLIEALNLPAPNALARYVLNDIDEIGRSFVLVLDDYHHIRDQDVNELVSTIIRYAPSETSFVLITRRDPPLRLATIRASGALTEIGAEDLRFKRDETRELLKNRLNGSFDAIAADTLHERFEGWPAGLRLASLSFPSWDELALGLNRIGHGLVHVTDFMIEEVLARQSNSIAESLMEASILDRISAPLWDALAPTGDGPRALQLVQQEHLFVVALDKQGEWIRFHHLFQKLLQDQLKRRRTSQEIAALHLRACNWFEQHGHVEDAIRHALSANDESRAAEVVERNGPQEINNDRWYVVLKWMELLPDSVKGQRIELLLIAGWLAYFRARYEMLPSIIQRIEECNRLEALNDKAHTELEFLRAVVLYFAGDVYGSNRACAIALRRRVEACQVVSGEVHFLLALTLHGSGHTQNALLFLEEERRKAVLHGQLFRVRLDAAISCVHLLAGNAQESVNTANRLRLHIGKSARGYASLWTYFMLGAGHLQALRLEDAREAFLLARENRDYAEPRLAFDALLGLTLTQQLLSESDLATHAAEELMAYVHEKGEPDRVDVADSFHARLALLNGDLPAALKWATSADPVLDAPSMFFWLEQPALTKCRIQFTQNTPESLNAALDTLNALHPEVERLNLIGQLIEVETLQSLVLDKLGHNDQAQTILLHAVHLAERGAWLRPFVESGPAMLDLIERVASRRVPSNRLDKIRGAIHAYNERYKEGVPSPSHQTADGLTPRESEVLSLLAAGLSNQAIAEKLCISAETVKKRLYNTYQKLHVHSRTAALSRAKALGILPIS